MPSPLSHVFAPSCSFLSVLSFFSHLPTHVPVCLSILILSLLFRLFSLSSLPPPFLFSQGFNVVLGPGLEILPPVPALGLPGDDQRMALGIADIEGCSCPLRGLALPFGDPGSRAVTAGKEPGAEELHPGPLPAALHQAPSAGPAYSSIEPQEPVTGPHFPTRKGEALMTAVTGHLLPLASKTAISTGGFYPCSYP